MFGVAGASVPTGGAGNRGDATQRAATVQALTDRQSSPDGIHDAVITLPLVAVWDTEARRSHAGAVVDAWSPMGVGRATLGRRQGSLLVPVRRNPASMDGARLLSPPEKKRASRRCPQRGQDGRGRRREERYGKQRGRDGLARLWR